MSDNDSNDCLSEFDDSVECFIDSGIQNTNLSTIPSNNDLDTLIKSNVVLLYTNKIISKCRNCDFFLNFQFNNFIHNPPWIFIQTNEGEIFGHDLPKQLVIGFKNYLLLSATIHLENHFRSIFYINKEFSLIDDLSPTKRIKKIPKIKIVTCFYCNSD